MPASVFLGGVLSDGPGWRWVLFVNIPVCVIIVGAAFALVPDARGRGARTNDLLAAHTAPAQAATAGFQRAILASAASLILAALIALRATHTRGHAPQAEAEAESEAIVLITEPTPEHEPEPGPKPRPEPEPEPAE